MGSLLRLVDDGSLRVDDGARNDAKHDGWRREQGDSGQDGGNTGREMHEDITTMVMELRSRSITVRRDRRTGTLVGVVACLQNTMQFQDIPLPTLARHRVQFTVSSRV